MKKVVLALLLIVFSFPVAAKDKESVYDRVMKTGTIRCGYGVFPPIIMKEPNTGEIKGIFADIMNEIGKVSDLKIEWVQEVDWGQIPQALSSGKIDAMCAGMWGTPKRGKVMAFSKPLFFSYAKAYARYDDNRFDNNMKAINDPQVKLSVNDGDISMEIAERFFPKADRVSKIQLAGEDFLLMNVATQKADIALTTPSIAQNYIKNNPKSIKEIPLPNYLAINQNVIGVGIHDDAMVRLLNAAIDDLQYNGVIKGIFEKYGDEAKQNFLLRAGDIEN